jgi:hypothetical protein
VLETELIDHKAAEKRRAKKHDRYGRIWHR